ncbi:GCN5 family acetyltransferase [Chlorella sorokiniana]|uniref:GCN5 family acetyltransferase n=1 Tax=Chlorella sorokiniana TaxID=3076 RepID=A0A2P6TKS2_CHLSO|nr:GCN5 family acetyltransferase [Chlorella sorokiniana]|eukprot:PRW44883.1 GCN5 family acetyltransferase [Chlorella sorokiniana]
MIPAVIAVWQQWLGPAASRHAVRPLDPTADAATAAAAKATLTASLGRDAHSLQYAATPEGARALAEDMAAVNLDRAARRPAGSPPPLFFVTDGERGVLLAFRCPDEQPSYGSVSAFLRHAKLSYWLQGVRDEMAVRRCAAEFRRQHPRYIHLLQLAVHPARQGKGLGSRLLRHLTRLADREGLPLYLEASNPRNRALYLQHGFTDFQTVQASGGTPYYAMARLPRGSKLQNEQQQQTLWTKSAGHGSRAWSTFYTSRTTFYAAPPLCLLPTSSA